MQAENEGTIKAIHRPKAKSCRLSRTQRKGAHMPKGIKYRHGNAELRGCAWANRTLFYNGRDMAILCKWGSFFAMRKSLYAMAERTFVGPDDE